MGAVITDKATRVRLYSMDRQEILLREFESCERENHQLTNHYWTIFGILASGNTIAIGLLASITQFELSSFWSIIGIVILGIGAIFMLHHLRLYRRRIDFRIFANYERMREIESDLKMWRGWRIFGIDDQWDKIHKKKYSDVINPDERARLLAYHPESWWIKWTEKEVYHKPAGRHMADIIIWTLKAFWLLSALIFLLRFLLDC